MPSNSSTLDRIIKALMISLYLIGFLGLSLYVAHFTEKTDFPVFYSTAKTVLNKGIFSDAIYTIDHDNQYLIPEENEDLTFIYSKAAALLLAPLGLLPYYWAKALMIFLNILAYLGGTFLLLKLLGFSGRMHLFTWGISFFWLPFLQVVRFGQIDGLLFFFIVGALWFAEQKRPFPAGAMIGVAMLFKIFPLALAMVLAFKNRKILLGCLIVFVSSLLIPGAIRWFTAIPEIYPRAFSVIYLYLKSIDLRLYLLYVLIIGGTTAFQVYKKKDMTYPHIFALTLPAIYLTMPIVEYYHLTMLAISFLFLLKYFFPLSLFKGSIMVFSIATISFFIKVGISPIIFIELFLLWFVLSIQSEIKSIFTEFSKQSKQKYG